ncbi:MAG: glycine--tRNA ligase subunit beta [Simkaniaceae bacterium]|nr:glycine--tRNA ligase subunit beta [Simkaniaceae bacterium]MCF7851683.1 glycine--tRNA ligase subunit beta [Simkaniaceae bacterium]
MLTFQEMILKLIDFWSKEGCIVHQPHDIETGAGTFNPATFLKVLGPEPYSCVYVEPSKRPQDGRYGDNPNRTQLFHQLQVVIKPSPSDIQQKYLRSLEAVGFDLSKHDVRFVHDDWESPTLGAWGLGWEVWIDGMEITQFTYFQSVAGIALNPVSVEITYGLERLSMLLQKKTNFFDMQYNHMLTYGDVFHRNEVEFSTYNFEQATVDMWQKHFEDFEKEAQHLLQHDLPLPAYDFVIKASHAFNMLEARGAISTTERMRLILRIRHLAKQVAEKYIATRANQGFPLLKYLEKHPLPQEAPFQSPTDFDPQQKDDFLLEIGSEQLPAGYVLPGAEMLENKVKKLLKDYKLNFESTATYATPQRLAVMVKGLRRGLPEETTTRKGPPLQTAFDSTGALTSQGEGFFKALAIDDLTLAGIREGKHPNVSIEILKGIEYLFVTTTSAKRSTIDILHTELPQLIQSMVFDKNMHWGQFDISYARPIKWILALFGTDVIPFRVNDIKSGSRSYGHAQRASNSIDIHHPSDYLVKLQKNFVLADIEERKNYILAQLHEIEKETKTKAVDLNRVMKEVLYLTEWPELTYASFDEKFLIAPKELLVSEMIEHQRYFPLQDKDGHLKNIFVITADNKVNDEVRSNNQKVISARLSDGVFLYQVDLKSKLEDFNEKLKKVTFQQELGSIYDKMLRVKKTALLLSEHLGIGDPALIVRAATLCKADLATELVAEFPELQGIVGHHYALQQGENPEVAKAIEEHWHPNSEQGPLPETTTGSLLALSDKIDNLLGYFSVGLKPSSSSDPYALRRQTLGIIKILIKHKWSLNLQSVFNEAYQFLHPNTSGEAIIKEILAFFKNRAKTIFEDYQLESDLIEASLSKTFNNPYDEFCKLEALHAFKHTQSFTPLLEVYKRAKGQIDKQSQMTLDPLSLKEHSEIELHHILQNLKEAFLTSHEERNYEAYFELLSQLQQPLANLFDQVKILSDNEQEKTNRIALLQEVFGYFAAIMDFSKVKS